MIAPRSRNGPRALLATWPQMRVVGEAAGGREVVRRLVEKRQADVVLMDAQMPYLDGLEATRVVKEMWPKVKVIVLAMCGSYRADAWAPGADAFLVKGCPTEELLETISGC